MSDHFVTFTFAVKVVEVSNVSDVVEMVSDGGGQFEISLTPRLDPDSIVFLLPETSAY